MEKLEIPEKFALTPASDPRQPERTSAGEFPRRGERVRPRRNEVRCLASRRWLPLVIIPKRATGHSLGWRRIVLTDVWSNNDLRTQCNSPILENGLIYGLSDRGNFFCLDAKTGTAAWTDSAKPSTFGSILDAGAVLLALPSNTDLTIFKANDKQFEEVAHYKVAATPPVVASAGGAISVIFVGWGGCLCPIC